MSTKYCSQCEIELKETAKFCPHCGGQLSSQPDPVTQSMQCPQCGKIYGTDHQFCADDGSQLQPRRTPTSSSPKLSPTAVPAPVLKIALLILGFLFLAALGTGGYLYFSGRWMDMPVLAKWFTPPLAPVLSNGVNKGSPAIVSEKEAVFTFPINPKKEYEWYKAGGALQYEWQIKVRNANNDFEFGFVLFPADYGKGNLKALLEAGQFNIWKMTKNGGSIVSNLKVQHIVSPDGKELKIKLIDAEAVKLLFSNKPKYVVFQSQVLDRKSSKKVPVIYTMGQLLR